MFEVSRDATFSAAHRLREYKGKCEAVHGHNWRVRATAEAGTLDSLGMVVDFKVLSAMLDEILAALDHADINAVPPFDTVNPSSENIAKFIFDELSRRLNDGRVRVARIEVWETDRSRATYSE